MSTEHTPNFIAPSAEELQPYFPAFTIQSIIAQGGMGAVYLAHQTTLDRTVALKVLPPAMTRDQAFRDGFIAEAKAMARLNHPNLISVFDSGEAGGLLYLVMEHIPNGSLYHAAYGNKIDQQEAARIVAELSQGLAHAHENGLIHRDIKPANILLDGHNRPKLGDFGIAQNIGDYQDGDDIYGTPGYTAPEVLLNPRAVDQRADVYSLGIVLYELLTSHLPPQPFQPASIVCGCDKRFDDILSRAIHRAPEMRYTTAAELANSLIPLITSADTTVAANSPSHLTAHNSTPMRSMGKQVRTLKSANSSGSGALVIVLILILAALGYYVYQMQTKAPNLQDPPADPTSIETPTL